VGRESDDRYRQTLRERLRDSFSNTYLTLLSIIQGTALALLFGKIDNLTERNAFHVPQAILALGLFLIIALLWHQYQIGLVLYAWVPQLVDALVPFSLGACEFVAILGLQHGALTTTVTLSLFFFFAIFAFEYQYAQVARAELEEPPVFARTFRFWDLLVCIASAVLLLIASALMRAPWPGDSESIAGGVTVVLVAAMHGVRQAIQWHIARRYMRDRAPV
jgi:hypothetical protein